MACDLKTVLAQACANNFVQLAASDPKMAKAVLLQLLCNISSGSVGGGGNPPVTYTADPNAEGVKPADVTKPAVAYSLDGSGSFYGWSVAQQKWV
jgi:hypothetical protein